MRKKIGKRIGPVPITLAVAVLAALAAFVAIQTNAVFAQTQIAEDKGCGVTFGDAFATGGVAIMGLDCTTADDEVAVTFKLADVATETDAKSEDVYIYRVGGNVGSKRAQMPYGFNGSGGHEAYSGLPLSTIIDDDTSMSEDNPVYKRAEEVGGTMRSKVGRGSGMNVEVTVTRQQADENGRVFLLAYAVEQIAAPATSDSSSCATPSSRTDGDGRIDLGGTPQDGA